jgi:hypothetical protein
MVSSLGRTASDTPVRDGGGRKRSISKERALICARKSRVNETSLVDVVQDRGTSRSRAASPGQVARGSSGEEARGSSSSETEDGSENVSVSLGQMLHQIKLGLVSGK